MTKTKVLILLTVFIDVVGLGIVIPILPFYVMGFSSSSLVITSLFAVYAVFSFLSAPLIGAVSDRVGRKAMLIVSIFSTSLGWFIFAAAPSLLFLFIGRIIDGAAAGNLPIAQAYLADIARDDKERTTNLGLIGAVFGIAFIIGPFLGGVLGAISHSFPFWAVGGLALINGILAIFLLPETHTERGEPRRISVNPLAPIFRAFRDASLRANYLAWALFGLAISTFQSVFTLYLNALYGIQEITVGFIFAGIGVFIALNQGVALKHFWLKRFREPDLELWMLGVFIAGFLLLTVKFIPLFILGLVGTTFGQSVLRVVMNSQILSKAPRERRGEVLGVVSSLTSLTMAVGPLLAGLLFGYAIRLPFVASAIFLAMAFAVMYRNRVPLGASQLVEEPVVSEI
jgi:MFS transporter, DHA1 family, tetracycline resistance protein